MQEAQQRVDRGAPGLVGQPEPAGHCDGNGVGIGERREVDVPDAVAVVGDHRRGDVERQSRLAGAPGSGEGDEPVGRQGIAEVPGFDPATDERRQLNGQPVCDRRARCP